jgi:hypothetical protein
MPRPIWRAVHVYYYDTGRTDDLILDAVRPLLDRLGDGVERAYFVRHWRGGPHVRIPILSEPAAFGSLVEPAVADVVGGYLADRPSTADLPPEDVLLPAHQRLADLERQDGPLRPLVPDNTVRYEQHDRRLRVLGGQAGSDLLAEFYTATNDLAFRMLAEIRAGRSPESVSLALMLAVAHSFGDPPGIDRGFISFRSHAEAFLHTCPEPERVRNAFERQFRANRAPLTRLVTAVLEALDQRRDGVPYVNEWVAAVRPFWSASRPLAERGELRLTPDGGEPGGPMWSTLESSPMHRMMAASTRFQDLFRDPQFKRYRLVLNYTYLHMARLGIMGYARFRLCHLAANAVEEALGISAIDTVHKVVTVAEQATGTGAGAG